MAQLFLWDIDGTLLTAGAASKAALYAAAAKVLGRECADIPLQTAGKTDPQIANDLLVGLGVTPDDLPQVIKLTLRAYGPELAARRHEISEQGQLFDGVREIMSHIGTTKAVNTVLTGNIAVNALCKLEAFRLAKHFDVEIGAFGSDNADRNELVDVVLDRAMSKRRKYFNESKIWVIGDTPLDFAVAQANNTRSLLVATGRHPLAELQSLGADAVVADLTDTAQIIDILFAD